MNNGRRMLVAALGTMTSAFVVAGQAEARSVGSGVIAPAQSGAIIALDQEELKRALLEMSPAEKLRIAGDRIRLAKSKVQPTSKATGAAKQTASAGATCTQRPATTACTAPGRAR